MERQTDRQTHTAAAFLRAQRVSDEADISRPLANSFETTFTEFFLSARRYASTVLPTDCVLSHGPDSGGGLGGLGPPTRPLIVRH